MNLPLTRPAPSALSRPLWQGTALMLAAAGLAGCSSLSSMMEGDKVDYRSRGAQTARLDVPPDLTQLQKDPRYQVPGGTVSAAALQQQANDPQRSALPTAGRPAVAIDTVGDVRIERAGTQRWLVVNRSPEQLWPQVKQFWQENGFKLTTDSPETGVLETDWAENRAKLPQDFIRRTLGRVLDSIYSTGELDRFRTRIERTGGGSEIYISHRGMEEVYVTQARDQTRWQPRKIDPDLEAQMLSQLMVKLGATQEQAQAVLATSAATPRARVAEAGGSPVVQMDEAFDRAWRRVGLSLDRSGFTVEDRDRAQGVYFVRYVPPRTDQDRRDPGLFARWFGGAAKDEAPARYRVLVKGEGEQRTVVSVLNAEGAPENSATGRRIVTLLAEDLK